MTFAADTSVSVAKSKAEIEDLILRAGGGAFAEAYAGRPLPPLLPSSTR